MTYTTGTLRRQISLNCPMPMLAVSPSPLMPIQSNFELATIAPVATEGMRPWSALKPWLAWRKYAGVLLEQPMPLILTVVYGLRPIALHASTR